MTVSKTRSWKNSRMSRATCCPRFVRSSYIVITTPAMSSDGLRAPRTRRRVPTRSASPSSAKYSQLSGMSTASAATRALSVSSPSDGGVSMNTKSKRRAKRLEDVAEATLAIRERDELDFGAGQIPVGGNQAEVLDPRVDDERSRHRRCARAVRAS